ncbi:MAG: dihydrofolate reductase [Terrimonas sp.]|nr:dihydrofolate reductase [Terrimonas sp.]
MKKLIFSMHLSLDGFVAGPNGEMDWIRVDEEIFDFVGKLTAQADTALYGRRTYEMMQAYWPGAGEAPDASKHDKEHSAWYNNVTKIVLSHTLKAEGLEKTRVLAGHLSEHIGSLKIGPGKDILVFGSPGAIQSLFREKLVDEYWLFVNPVILGAGISLFKDTGTRISMEFISAQTFSCGVIALHYKVK